VQNNISIASHLELFFLFAVNTVRCVYRKKKYAVAVQVFHAKRNMLLLLLFRTSFYFRSK